MYLSKLFHIRPCFDVWCCNAMTQAETIYAVSLFAVCVPFPRPSSLVSCHQCSWFSILVAWIHVPSERALISDIREPKALLCIGRDKADAAMRTAMSQCGRAALHHLLKRVCRIAYRASQGGNASLCVIAARLSQHPVLSDSGLGQESLQCSSEAWFCGQSRRICIQ